MPKFLNFKEILPFVFGLIFYAAGVISVVVFSVLSVGVSVLVTGSDGVSGVSSGMLSVPETISEEFSVPVGSEDSPSKFSWLDTKSEVVVPEED